MEKVLIHGNRKKEGLTLVETVIALSIVVTVSLATVSIAVYSTNSLRSSANKGFFNHEIATFSDLYLSYEGASFSEATGSTRRSSLGPLPLFPQISEGAGRDVEQEV